MPGLDGTAIGSALDLGATGILVPHMRSPEAMQKLARLSHYGENGRGFSSTCRAADYGRKSRGQILNDARVQTCVLAMLEDPEVLDRIEECIAVEGIDGYFLGLADLSVAMGVDKSDPHISSFIADVADLARKHRKAVGLVINDSSEAAHWISRGMTFFLIGSDYGFLINGAQQLRNDFGRATS